MGIKIVAYMEKPVRFDLKRQSLYQFKKKYKIFHILDTYESQLKELFLIRNPSFKFKAFNTDLFKKFVKRHCKGKKISECGIWWYFPWSKTLVHYLREPEHQEVRTARNRNIITTAEQKKLYNSSVAIAGMSVGSHPALTLAIMGVAKEFRLADWDEISASNLNRIRADVTHIGLNKCVYVTRQIYQINPYAKIYAYQEGVNEKNIIKFLKGSNVLVEEVDNLAMKIKLRLAARKLKLPVVMVTDNGENVIADIERYDIHQNLQLFNGALGNFALEDFENFSPTKLPSLATKIAGSVLIVPRMKISLKEVGKSLYSWPQTGDAATLAGVVAAQITKRILLREKVKEGKISVDMRRMF